MSCTYVTLSTGQMIPSVGLGTWKSVPAQVKQAVLAALDNGYRHIDCAAAYSNEENVGEALRERVGPGKSLKREELFLTSKLWNTEHHPDDVEAACRRSLTHLGVSYLDLYLMHWPMAFDIARHKPVVNQVECHPFLAQQQLLTHCRDRGVAVAAYSPLGSPDRPWASPGEPVLMGDPRIKEIARQYGKTAAQVIIRWHVQRGIICIPKSITPSRIQQNLQVLDFQLTDEDMKLIESFNRNERLIIPTVEASATIFLTSNTLKKKYLQ
ncbi:aldo-keto reductase family 1 member A1-A isoform X4 [Paramormyrops kingsleyae]|uniref:aldo-keto reductase family 1 member A1-A isoform X4 n=1 Tax=Paramormyrops kingsleyae TaxID=1676925 RepID=UPI003B9768B9